MARHSAGLSQLVPRPRVGGAKISPTCPLNALARTRLSQTLRSDTKKEYRTNPALFGEQVRKVKQKKHI